MSIGFDEELHPYQEPKRDLSDIALLGNMWNSIGHYVRLPLSCCVACYHSECLYLYTPTYRMSEMACPREHFYAFYIWDAFVKSCMLCGWARKISLLFCGQIHGQIYLGLELKNYKCSRDSCSNVVDVVWDFPQVIVHLLQFTVLSVVAM